MDKHRFCACRFVEAGFEKAGLVRLRPRSTGLAFRLPGTTDERTGQIPAVFARHRRAGRNNRHPAF